MFDGTSERVQAAMMGLGLIFWVSLTLAIFFDTVNGYIPFTVGATIVLLSLLCSDDFVSRGEGRRKQLFSSAMMMVFSFGYGGPVPLYLAYSYFRSRK